MRGDVGGGVVTGVADVAMDDDAHGVNPRMASEGRDRPAKDSPAPECHILFGGGAAFAKPPPAPGGDDQGYTSAHGIHPCMG